MGDKSSKDGWARILGFGSLIVGVIGLCISYQSHQDQKKLSDWQKTVQAESLKEKLQDNVRLSGHFAPDGSPNVFSGKIKMQIEIVNIGQSKVFLKEVEVQAGQDGATAQLVGQRVSPWALEPGMNANFSVQGFEKHPLVAKMREDFEPFTVSVTTTKGRYQLEGHVNELEV
jgi:hypothetical protein